MKKEYKLETLYNLIVARCKAERKKDPSFDGLTYWRNIKGVCSDSIQASKWKKISQSTITEIMNLPEEIILANGKKELIEVNHFIIQQARIPTTEKPTLRKVLQVGLNVGQWIGNPDPQIYKQINYKYSDLHLLSRYLTTADIKKISEQIDDSLMDKIKNAIKQNI